MKTVAEILRNKPDQEVHSIRADATAYEAVKLMAGKNVGALLVVEAGKIVGILSERDYTRRVGLADRSPKQTPVREVMTSPVLYVSPAHTSEECMALMTDSRLRHLPVLDRGQLVGLVSIGDLVKDTISEQQFIIEQLEHYITGSPMS